MSLNLRGLLSRAKSVLEDGDPPKPKKIKKPKAVVKPPEVSHEPYHYGLANEPPKGPEKLHGEHPAVRASNIAHSMTKAVRPGHEGDHAKAAIAHRTAAQLAKKAGHHEVADAHRAMGDLHAKAAVKPAVHPPKPQHFDASMVPRLDPEKKPEVAHVPSHKEDPKRDSEISNLSKNLSATFSSDPDMHKTKWMKRDSMPTSKKTTSKIKKVKTEELDTRLATYNASGEAPEEGGPQKTPIDTMGATPWDVAQCSAAARVATDTCLNNPEIPPYFHLRAAGLHGKAAIVAIMHGDKERADYHTKQGTEHVKIAEQAMKDGNKVL